MPRANATEVNRRRIAGVRFIEPMYALAVKKLPQGKDRLYEVRFDGYRCLAWVRPEVVAQIEFAEWTADARLRHSTFVGLRDDKDPREVVRE
jgi:ATP-dependent DNA ligase